MTPDFDELVGTDLEPGERARLERVHELLIAAGPPPDLIDPGRRSSSSRRGADAASCSPSPLQSP